nr:WAS/WASL-interacting protein family member 1-like [Penaeus vannamei]
MVYRPHRDLQNRYRSGPWTPPPPRTLPPGPRTSTTRGPVDHPEHLHTRDRTDHGTVRPAAGRTSHHQTEGGTSTRDLHRPTRPPPPSGTSTDHGPPPPVPRVTELTHHRQGPLPPRDRDDAKPHVRDRLSPPRTSTTTDSTFLPPRDPPPRDLHHVRDAPPPNGLQPHHSGPCQPLPGSLDNTPQKVSEGERYIYSPWIA